MSVVSKRMMDGSRLQDQVFVPVDLVLSELNCEITAICKNDGTRRGFLLNKCERYTVKKIGNGDT